MRGTLVGSWCVLSALATPVVAAPAPDILGKSVLVHWTEDRQLRVDGTPRSGPVAFDLSIYISSAGRTFGKVAVSSRAVAAEKEHVGGTGTSLSGGVRSVQADGHTITSQTAFGNFARRMRIDIGAGGGSCSVQITVGKETGSQPKAFVVNGVTFEILSTAVSSSSCAMQDGNVFAR